MASRHFIALILVFSVCASGDPGNQQYYTDEGGDEFSCTEASGAVRPCHILEYAAEQTANSSGPVTIVIHNSHSTPILSRPVMFENIRGLTIQGNDTLVSCNAGGGLIFQSVISLEVSSFSLSGCGVTESGGNLTAAVHIQTCTNVTMRDVTISKSEGAAAMFFDTAGEILLHQLLISENGGNISLQDNYSSGVHIQLSKCPMEDNSKVQANYRIEECSFVHNTNVNGSGGGLGIQLNGRSCFNHVNIVKSRFTQNKAQWGGGLYVHFYGAPHDNSVTVSGCYFEANRAKGGGGADIGYYSYDNRPPFGNSVLFQDTTFSQNRGKFGGGTGIFAMHSTNVSEAGKTIKFNNCSWYNNSATVSPAVDIAPYTTDILANGFLPIPVFTNCYFSSNTVEHHGNFYGTGNAVGALLVTKFTVQFEGWLIVENHCHSPLQVKSGTVEFEAGSNVLFQNNTGTQGGAIAMYGFSLLRVKQDSSFRFINNTARDVGGAIYFQSFDQHDFVYAHTCFIQYSGAESKDNSVNVSIKFEGNTASNAGQSIFATSLYPCYHQYYKDLHQHTYLEAFQKIANFDFDNFSSSSAFGTEGATYEYHQDGNELQVIPGKRFTIPVEVRDELRNEIVTLFRISTTEDGSLEADRTHTAHKRIRLFATPNYTGYFTLYAVSFREIAIPIKFTLLDCPPGYFYYHLLRRCKCAAYFQERAYPGIVHCNSSLFQAYIEHGYWAGYPSGGHVTPDKLYTALCPLGFCSFELESAGPLFLLPNISSKGVLDYWMCGQYRTGVLCGKCDRGFSVYYHSRQYKCATSDNCRLGVLYYILSEIIPLMILFTTVIVFDIRFTSGALNGFVFFSQVLDTLSIDARGTIKFPTSVDLLSVGYRVLYGLLNFDFFEIEQLSFCLWENATVLDAVAFKYVTVVFALILVVALVTLMRWCDCRQLCKIKRKISTKQSVIHGLTAFLVMCYVQCTRVSFQILTAVTLTGKGGHSGDRVTFYGGLLYLGKEHLPYAIPAFTCVATIMAIPPIVLVVFPLCNHILAWLGLLTVTKRFRLYESTAYGKITSFLQVNQLKPLLDSFQGCFKDKLRFFAGLYFIYRIAILAAYTFTTSALQFYFTVEALIVLMLVVHATTYPYINRLHNVIDSLVFGNLAVINGLIIYNFYLRFNTPSPAVYWIQLVLIYLPLVSMAVFIIKKIGNATLVFSKVQISQSLPEEYGNLALDSPDGYIDHDHLPYQEFELCPHTREASPPERPDFGIDDD